MCFLPKEVVSLIFLFQSQWKFLFHWKTLLHLEKLHSFCQHYYPNLEYKYYPNLGYNTPVILLITINIPILKKKKKCKRKRNCKKKGNKSKTFYYITKMINYITMQNKIFVSKSSNNDNDNFPLSILKMP